MLKEIYRWLLGILFFEVLSFFVIFHGTVNTVLTILLGLIAFVVSVRRPAWILPVLAIEFLIGSKGALFKAFGDASNDGGISIRIVLFAAFFAGWFVWILWNKHWKEWRSWFEGKTMYLILAVALLYAFIVGWVRGNHAFLFADANAWGAWLLLLPVLDLARTEKEYFIRRIMPAVLAAVFWLPVKTLFLFYFFTHLFPDAWIETVYLWVRRTGVGEVTHVGAGAYRIFFQSHIYALFVIYWLLIKRTVSSKFERWEWALLIISLAEMIISLSRSFFVGFAVGGLVLFIWLLIRSRSAAWLVLSRGVIAFFLSLILIIGLFFTPIPPRGTSSFLALLQSRFGLSDDAASSRWNLLPVLWKAIERHPILGSGFGATVTYESKDPRIVAKTGGIYTTYAFEWGWLEHWFKLGLIGIPLIASLLIVSGKNAWKILPRAFEATFIILSFVILAAVHIFTPYLNHPLGFAWLIAVEGYLMTKTSPRASLSI